MTFWTRKWQDQGYPGFRSKSKWIGGEKGAMILSQGGSGPHGKEMMGRKGITEPKELGDGQNVGEVRKREGSH